MANVIEFTIKGSDAFSKTFSKFSSGVTSLGRSAISATKSVVKLGAAMVAITTAAAIPVLRTAASFESLRATLKSVTGSAENAAIAFSGIKAVAVTTPFQVADLTQTFIKLKSFGLEPTGKVMRAITDQASALGGSVDSLNGITLALGQAWAKQKLQGEEILQLVERGVPVWELLSEELGVTAQQLQKMSERGELGREAISKLITAIGDRSFGAASEQMDTLNGAWSNFKDTVDNTFDTLGRSGGISLAKVALQEATAVVVELGQGILLVARIASVAFSNIRDNINSSIASGTLWEDFVNNATAAFSLMFDNFAAILPRILDVGVSAFKVLWESFLTLGRWAFDRVFQVYIGGFPQVIAAIGGFFVLLWEGVVESAQWAWDNIKAIFTDSEFVGLDELLFKNIPEKTKETRDNIEKILGDIKVDSPDLATVLTTDLVANTKAAREELEKDLTALAVTVSDRFTTTVSAIGAAIGISKEQIDELILGVQESFTESAAVLAENNKAVAASTNDLFSELSKKFIEFSTKQGTVAKQLAKELFTLYNSVVNSISNSIASAIVDGKSLAKSLMSIMDMVAKEIIAMLIRIGIQRVVTASIFGAASVAEAETQVAANVATASTAAYASTAAIPIVGPALAPAAAASAGATTTAIGAGGIAAAIAAAAAIYALAGQRHAGGDIPRSGTYNLEQGEVVIPRNPSQDVVDSLNRNFGGNSGGSSVTVENMVVEVLPRATSFEALMQMSDRQMLDIVSEKILQPLTELSEGGVKDIDAQRGFA